MKTKLFNPFTYIAGGKALLLGICAMLLTALLCCFTKEHVDGVVDIHVGRETAPYVYFAEPFIDWLCLVLPLYIFGRIFSTSSIRLIDVAGTLALARYPMFFAVLAAMLTPANIHSPDKLMATLQSNPALLAKLIIAGLLVLPAIIWTVGLAFNAYSVSANLKGSKALWSFIASMIIAEGISKIIISFLI